MVEKGKLAKFWIHGLNACWHWRAQVGMKFVENLFIREKQKNVGTNFLSNNVRKKGE